jgi:predicted nucleotidyltransferase
MVTAAKDRLEVITRIEPIRQQLRAHGVRRLALFGSFARDAQRNDSDVDLLVDFLPGRKSFDAYTAVCELLEEVLQRRVELLTPESLSPYIGPRILREAEDVLLAD